MKVRSLELCEFMSHKKTRVTFPEAGLFYITGPNGSGKTSLLEGVSVGLWGGTLRKTSPWSSDKGHVKIVTEGPCLEIERSHSGQTVKLAWNPPGQSDEAKDEAGKPLTTTKAQTKLEALIGEHGTWQKTSVFSSHDAALFTQSTDAERKQLLEAVLGLDKFDVALRKCRDELKVAERDKARLTHEVELLSAKLESEKTHLRENQEGLTQLPKVSSSKSTAKLTELSKSRDSCANEKRQLEIQIEEHKRAISRAEGSLQALVSRSQVLTQHNCCPTCDQAISDELKDGAKAALAQAKAQVRTQKEAAQKEVTGLQSNIDELSDELEVIIESINKTRSDMNLAKTVEAQRARFEQVISGAAKKMKEYEADIGTKTDKLDLLAEEIGDLEMCERILGIQGLRSHMLSRALSGLEDLANNWLDKLVGRGLQLRLKPYSEKKSGGVKEAIGLEVVGAGGGFGYKAASGGERRRIDVALVLALAEIAEAASGIHNRALFFDEVFDTLDEDGTAAVVAALQSLSQSRQVFVISHSQLLAKRIEADVHLTVENGVVQ